MILPKKRKRRFPIPMSYRKLAPFILELKILSRLREQESVKQPDMPILNPMEIGFAYRKSKHIQKMHFRERFPEAIIP